MSPTGLQRPGERTGGAVAKEAQAERDAVVPRSAQLLNRQHDKLHAYWPGRKRSAEAPSHCTTAADDHSKGSCPINRGR